LETRLKSKPFDLVKSAWLYVDYVANSGDRFKTAVVSSCWHDLSAKSHSASYTFGEMLQKASGGIKPIQTDIEV
jgi:hypothetical protein